MPDPEQPSSPSSVPEHVASDTDYIELSRNLRELALRLVRQQATADDVVQEAWLASLDEPPERIGNLNAWLRQVVRNLAARSYRRNQRIEDVESTAARPEAVADPEPPASRASLRQLLHDSVETLREPYRSVLTRRFLDDCTVKEVARELGRTPATVRSQVRRGLGELRLVLDARHGGKRETWLPALALFARDGVDRVPRSTPLGAGSGLVPALLATGGLVTVMLVTGPERSSAPDMKLAVSAPATNPGALAPVGDIGGPADSIRAREVPAVDPDVARRTSPTDPGGTSGVKESATLPGPDSSERELEVYVRRADGSLPENGRVRVWGKGMVRLGEFEADADGRAMITVSVADLMEQPMIANPHGGVWVAGRDRDEAWSLQHNVALPPGKATRRVDVRSRGPALELRISVHDEGGEAVPGASVVIVGSTGALFSPDGAALEEQMAMHVTDDGGEIALDGMSRRLYRFIVTAPEFVGTDLTFDGASPRVGPVLDAPIVLARGSVVYGEIHGPEGPVSGALVWEQDWLRAQLVGHQYEAQADENGFYEHNGFGAGRHRLFARLASDPTLFACEVVTVPPGEDLPWNPILARATPTVLLILDEGGSPLGRAGVVLSNRDSALPWGSDIVSADAEGLVSFIHCPPGDLYAMVTRPSDAEEIFSEHLVHSGERTVIRLEPHVGLGGIGGLVLTEEGLPPDHATVFGVQGKNTFDVPVDRNTGAFRAQGLNAGVYRLSMLTDFGLVDLGARDVLAGGIHELEVIRIPRPITIPLEWVDALPSRDEPWRVTCLAPWRRVPVSIRVISAECPSLELLAGRYRIAPASDPDLGTAFQVGIEMNTAVRVKLH